MNPRHAVAALRSGHLCEYCHAPEVASNIDFEVEHIAPRSADGSNDVDNLALSCRSCNLHKSNAVVGIDSETGKEEPLFHPRRDVWAEHLTLDYSSGHLIGKTAKGRATIARLRMNSYRQVTARLLWIQAKLI